MNDFDSVPLGTGAMIPGVGKGGGTGVGAGTGDGVVAGGAPQVSSGFAGGALEGPLNHPPVDLGVDSAGTGANAGVTGLFGSNALKSGAAPRLSTAPPTGVTGLGG